MNSVCRSTSLCRVASLILAQRSSALPIQLSTMTTTTKTKATSGLRTTRRHASYCYSKRYLQTKSVQRPSTSDDNNNDDESNSRKGFFSRALWKINPFDITEQRLKRSGYLLYETVADQIDYQKFFIELNMKDTFFSWFLVTELHVWMLMVRTIAEQDHGKIVRNNMLEAMWDDATTRAKVLWSENPSGIRKNIRELSEQFNCAIIGYDEGVNGDDKILAGAIWRRIFQSDSNDPESLEKLLAYVRKQIFHLDKLPKEDILRRPKIDWISLGDMD